MQDFDEDDPTDVITIDHETDKSDVDDLLRGVHGFS